MSATHPPTGSAALNRLILERLGADKRAGFGYRALEPLGPEAMQHALAQGILRETHRAETIEHPDPNAPTFYDLEVDYINGGIYGVSAQGDAWVEPVPLTENDIRQFEVVLPKLWARICADNHISQAIRENEHEIVYLGEREVAGYGTLMTFFLYNNTEELRFLERCRRISGERWTVVLTPVPVSLLLQSQRQIASWRLLLVPMSIHLGPEGWGLPWRKIAASQPGQGGGEGDLQPVADLVYERLPGLECSPDFRTVRLRGESFSLTPTMAQVFKALVELSARGPRDLDKYAILERGESKSKKMADVFKHLEGWQKLIVPGRVQGTFRINIPEP